MYTPISDALGREKILIQCGSATVGRPSGVDGKKMAPRRAKMTAKEIEKLKSSEADSKTKNEEAYKLIKNNLGRKNTTPDSGIKKRFDPRKALGHTTDPYKNNAQDLVKNLKSGGQGSGRRPGRSISHVQDLSRVLQYHGFDHTSTTGDTNDRTGHYHLNGEKDNHKVSISDGGNWKHTSPDGKTTSGQGGRDLGNHLKKILQ